jgi:cephalosporin hydroxylase
MLKSGDKANVWLPDLYKKIKQNGGFMGTELQKFLHSIDGIHGGITRKSIPIEVEAGEYDNYARIIAAEQPKTVLEIGVLFGFSAVAMLWGGRDCVEKYVGCDIELFTKGSNEIARKNIDLLYKHISVKCPRENVWFLKEPHTFPTENFDLIHIDGDHSFKSCYNDLKTYYPKANKIVLVHDYFYKNCPEVKPAVDQFEKDIGGFKAKEAHRIGYGLLLIRK